MKYTIDIETQILRIGMYAIGEDRFTEEESVEVAEINDAIMVKIKNLAIDQRMIIRRWE